MTETHSVDLIGAESHNQATFLAVESTISKLDCFTFKLYSMLGVVVVYCLATNVPLWRAHLMIHLVVSTVLVALKQCNFDVN